MAFSNTAPIVRVGREITPLIPQFVGGTVGLSCSGTVPPGLSLNPTTGAITGTPTTVTEAPIQYTISCGTSGGSASATLSFDVLPGKRRAVALED